MIELEDKMPRDFEDHCWKEFFDEETLQIYSHYARDVYVGKRPAVLMVDVYKASYEGGQQKVSEVIKEFPSSCGERAWAYGGGACYAGGGACGCPPRASGTPLSRK